MTISSPEGFLQTWHSTMDHFATAPGFTQARLHRNTGPNDTTVQYVNLVLWEDVKAHRAAFLNFTQSGQRIPGVKAYPGLFEVYAEVDPTHSRTHACIPLINAILARPRKGRAAGAPLPTNADEISEPGLADQLGINPEDTWTPCKQGVPMRARAAERATKRASWCPAGPLDEGCSRGLWS